MTSEKREKLEMLNEDFKDTLLQIMAGDSHLPPHIVGPRGLAEWSLCAAYIDWFEAMYDEIDEPWRYERMIVDTLEGFVKKFRNGEEDFDLVETTMRFEYLLELVSLCRYKTFGRIECTLLNTGVVKIEEGKEQCKN